MKIFKKKTSKEVELAVERAKKKLLEAEKDDVKVEEAKPETVSEKLDDLRQDINLILQRDRFSKKGKEVKLPGRVRRQLKTLGAKNKILVFLLQVNRGLTTTVTDVRNGLILVNKKFHAVSPDFVFLWQGKYPAIVLPEWDLQPIGTKDYYDAMDSGRSSDPQEIIIKAIEASEAGVVPKKQVNWKAIAIFVVIALVAGYVLFSGKGTP